MNLSKVALGFRTSEIKALSDKLSFGKYKGWTVEEIIGQDANYILWLQDEKIMKVSAKILEYAEEADTEQRLDAAMGDELRGLSYYDFIDDFD